LAVGVGNGPRDRVVNRLWDRSVLDVQLVAEQALAFRLHFLTIRVDPRDLLMQSTLYVRSCSKVAALTSEGHDANALHGLGRSLPLWACGG